MNQHYFDVPFAFAGDVTAIPDPLQTGGSVSMTEGWNFNYQRDLATDPAALPIDRSTTNWLLLQITTALQALQKETVPEFILASQNGGTAISYGLGSVVLWSSSGNAPFQKFVSLTAGNTNTPSASDPLGTTTGWQVVCDPIATSAQAGAGTNNASIMTPLLVAQQTALRALLAGSSSQVFNVGLATSATQAPQFQQIAGVVGTMRNLVSSVVTAGVTKTVTADEVIVESALGGLRYCMSSLNLTGNLTTQMDTGSAPASGFVAEYLIYNPNAALSGTNPRLLYTNATSAAQPNIYGGANMPAGYTASALISVWPTNSSGQFTPAYQTDRSVSVNQITVLSSSTSQGSFTSFSLSAAVPLNGKTVNGWLRGAGTAVGNFQLIVSPTTSGVGAQTLNGVSPSANQSTSCAFSNMPLPTAQTLYYESSISAGTPTYSVVVNGYTF